MVRSLSGPHFTHITIRYSDIEFVSLLKLSNQTGDSAKEVSTLLSLRCTGMYSHTDLFRFGPYL